MRRPAVIRGVRRDRSRIEVGGEFLDIERAVQPRVQRFRVDERAYLRGLTGEQSPDEWIDSAHDGALRGRAVADVADLVGEDLAVEQFDSLGHVGLVGEKLNRRLANREQFFNDLGPGGQVERRLLSSVLGHLGKARLSAVNNRIEPEPCFETLADVFDRALGKRGDIKVFPDA